MPQRKRQAFGARAKQAMSELVFGKDIELRPQAIDRYGRTVAQVGVDGKDTGVEMLRKGLAWVYDRYITEASTEIRSRSSRVHSVNFTWQTITGLTQWQRFISEEVNPWSQRLRPTAGRL